MKNILMLLTFISALSSGYCQTKPNGKKPDAPPTQKEMEQMMKEAQRELDNLDPETKRMMDSMGIKMPSFNQIPSMTDAQLQEAYENQNRVVPVKDVARIASIPKTPLTTSSIPTYLTATHAKVIQQLKPAARAKGEEIYQSVKAQYNSDAATGNAATGLWMLGKTQLALYVMGKACVDYPSNTDNLNNYAAMLSMNGAEQLALPLLEHLNKRFHKNSTILNNIGQAWFGLGDLSKASVYLDSAIRIYASHPQANYAKSLIEESKGNTMGAIEAMKRSIKMAYSQSKEDRLKKLEYNLKPDDIQWNQPMPQDALGLEKIHSPAFPKNVSESEVLEKEWNDFIALCENELDGLHAQETDLQRQWEEATAKRTQMFFQAGQKGLAVNPFPPLAIKAMIKLKHLVSDNDGHNEFASKSKYEALEAAYRQVEQLTEQRSNRMNDVREKYDPEFGEGKKNPFEAACADENNVTNEFLRAANTLLEQRYADYLQFLRKKLNDEVYYYQYTQWPDEFELTKIRAKITWLGWIKGQKVMFGKKSAWCQPSAETKPVTAKLAAFDDVHCMYHSELVTPVGTIRTDCSRVTTTLDLKVVKLGLKQDMERETFGDQFMTCSVEVGVGTGAGMNMGPLKAEASIGAGIAAEFDRNGLSDLVIKTSASVGAGTDIIKDGSMAGVGVGDLSVDVGVQAQISLISGASSVESTGLLGGVFKK